MSEKISLSVVFEDHNGETTTPVNISVDKSLKIHRLKLLLAEQNLQQQLADQHAHRILLSRNSSDKREPLDPRKEIGLYSFGTQDTLVVRLAEAPAAIVESDTSVSEGEPEYTSVKYVRDTQQASKQNSQAQFGEKTPKKPVIKFTPESLKQHYEKVKKYLPENDSIREFYECRAHIGMITDYKGTLYLTNNSVLFFGKKIGKFWKLWKEAEILDIHAYEKEKEKGKGIRLIEDAKKLSQVFFFFAEETPARDQALRNIRKMFYRGSTTAIHHAIFCLNEDKVSTIMEYNPESLTELNSSDQTPLAYACSLTEQQPSLPADQEAVRYQLVDLIIKFYRDNPDKVDINQTTLRAGHILHTVCSLNHSDRLLLQLLKLPGINVNVTIRPDETTPLHYFVRHNESHDCASVGELFFELGAKVNATTQQHETPLHHAMMNKKVRGMMVELLLKHNADVNLRGGRDDDTPLFYALRLGRFDLVDQLLGAGSHIKLEKNATGRTERNAVEVAQQEYEKNAKSEIGSQYLKNLNILQNVERLQGYISKTKLQITYSQIVKAISESGGSLEDPAVIVKAIENDEFLEKLGITVIGQKMTLRSSIREWKENLDSDRKKKEIEEALKRHTSNIDADDVRNVLGITASDNEIPENNLEFTAKLGSGAFGAVFKGFIKPNTGIPVAIKLLYGADLTEFKKEFQILRSVSGPHIVKFHGFCIDKHLAMVMEFCERGSLYDVLKKNSPPLNWKQALSFAIGMANGMTVLHGHKPPIFHRDMKSLNLLVTRENVVKVCDFGLSRLVEQNSMSTFKNVRGTMAYCAPEIIDGVHLFTDKSDVYSMGIVLWELIFVTLNGRYEQPFAEYGLAVEYAIIITAQSGKRPTLPSNTPKEIAELYLHSVNPDPEKRPTASNFEEQLKAMAAKIEADEKAWTVQIYIPPAGENAASTAATGAPQAKFTGWGKKKD